MQRIWPFVLVVMLVNLAVGERVRGTPLFRGLGGGRIAADAKYARGLRRYKDNDSIKASTRGINPVKFLDRKEQGNKFALHR